ncbi:MAG: hypothetical protein EOO00_14135, partial [Chitinophagaceae bacterium]
MIETDILFNWDTSTASDQDRHDRKFGHKFLTIGLVIAACIVAFLTASVLWTFLVLAALVGHVISGYHPAACCSLMISRSHMHVGDSANSAVIFRLEEIVFIDYYSRDESGEGVSDRLEINYKGKKLEADVSKMPVNITSDLLLTLHTLVFRINIIHEEVEYPYNSYYRSAAPRYLRQQKCTR